MKYLIKNPTDSMGSNLYDFLIFLKSVWKYAFFMFVKLMLVLVLCVWNIIWRQISALYKFIPPTCCDILWNLFIEVTFADYKSFD